MAVTLTGRIVPICGTFRLMTFFKAEVLMNPSFDTYIHSLVGRE
ncbi:MAG: hypothetical protein K0Q73_8573, partial [Paenibacillus sp.]|nr:hypothetical protein [Paenibacillus sp.]